MVGSPSAHLWISSPAPDVDIYVYLEVLRSMGGSEVVSHGALRASHRKTGTAPYDVHDLPWQTHLRKDAAPLQPDQPTLVEIAMTPTAYVVREHDSLRLSVTTRPPFPGYQPPPPVTIHSGGEHASYLEIPWTDTKENALSDFSTIRNAERLNFGE